MKKTIGAFLVAGLALFLVAPVLSYTGGTGVTGTPHDLSSAGGYYYGGDTQQRICIFCHTPHNSYRLSPANGGPPAGIGTGPQATDAFDYLPLWNHTLQTDTNYSMYYAGPGQPATGAAAQQTLGIQVPGSVSLLCLSCHDGSVAVNSYGNISQPASSQGSGGTMIRAAYTIGGGKYLGNHHPIGFDYVAVWTAEGGATGGLNPVTTTMYNGPISNHLYSSSTGGSTTVMECGTCHSVHNKGNDPAGQMFLWKADTQSQLCLTCHNK